jgi:putative modified peptide
MMIRGSIRGGTATAKQSSGPEKPRSGIEGSQRGTDMTGNASTGADDREVPRDLALKLLRRLSDDDAFRTAYEKDPVAALRSIGFPDEIIRGLPAGYGGPLKLGAKPVFQEALYQVIDCVAHLYYCQRPPNVKLAVGESATLKDPFQGS